MLTTALDLLGVALVATGAALLFAWPAALIVVGIAVLAASLAEPWRTSR